MTVATHFLAGYLAMPPTFRACILASFAACLLAGGERDEACRAESLRLPRLESGPLSPATNSAVRRRGISPGPLPTRILREMSFGRKPAPPFARPELVPHQGPFARSADTPGGSLAILRWLWRRPFDRAHTGPVEGPGWQAEPLVPPAPLREESPALEDALEREPWLVPSYRERLPAQLQATSDRS